MLAFWSAGLFGLYFALDQEVAVVRATNPRSIHVERGKAFRRERLWTDHASFWITNTTDSDDDPYFKLVMDAPGGKLVIKEGHYRQPLETLQRQVEAAILG
jgi:hypothetical protein